ncbi:hypothetical protein BgiBS90_013144 [Biomphalaria glabrata]|nr:hypothetical protein BgiBS90_013144 [Biomphalaria glabrata]
MCTSAIIIDIGIDECQSTQAKSELSRGRHSKLELEETYLLDVRLLGEGDCGALDFVCNVAACEPAVSLEDVRRQGLLKQRVRSADVLKKTVLDTITLCVKRPRTDYSKLLKNSLSSNTTEEMDLDKGVTGISYLSKVICTVLKKSSKVFLLR